MVKWCIACIYSQRTEVSRVVYTRNTPLNHDSYNIYANPLQRGCHFDEKYTTCAQNRDQCIYIYIYNIYIYIYIYSCVSFVYRLYV